MDPEISVIKKNRKWPDILEEKLSHVKEMVAYIHTRKKEGDS
jgi:hypothetical protein